MKKRAGLLFAGHQAMNADSNAAQQFTFDATTANRKPANKRE